MTRRAVAKDIFIATNLTLRSSASSLATSWILVPAGICAMLAVCFAVDTLFRAVEVSFPASVACLLLLFFTLLASELVLGAHHTRKIVAVINVPASWSLRWINVFFTPAFVLLPLSPSIGVVEVFKIIAVFVIGFFVMMVLAAYLTRALQLVLGSSKRSYAERGDELSPNSGEDIPLAASSADRSSRDDTSFSSPDLDDASSGNNMMSPQSPPQLRLQQHHYDDRRSTSSQTPLVPNGHAEANGHGSASSSSSSSRPPIRRQSPPPPCRSDVWAAHAKANLDLCVYAVLFALVGLPIYYTTGYAMPAQLTASILCYFAAMAIPAQWRQYLHPVLVSSLLTVLLIWPLAAIKGDDLPATLGEYKTGANYLRLWAHAASTPNSPDAGDVSLLPGAGDMLSTVLDASIVSLALPMFQYRRELRQHFTSIVVPNVAISLASLLAYPPLCVKIGIAPGRSLAFASRSLTLALATPATKNLGGDLHTVAALAIVSGIMGVLVGQRILAWIKIPEDDYVTRGVTLGVNSSAIATALLLKTDPRAAALSSLSMTLFGTVTVLFTSIPPAATLVRSFVGL